VLGERSDYENEEGELELPDQIDGQEVGGIEDEFVIGNN
jgi:hypothetical protein